MAYHITYILQIKLRDNIVRTVTLMYVTVTKIQLCHPHEYLLPSRSTNDMLSVCAFLPLAPFVHPSIPPILHLLPLPFSRPFFTICTIFMLVAHKYLGPVTSVRFHSMFNNKIKNKHSLSALFGWLMVRCVSVPADVYFSESDEMGCPYRFFSVFFLSLRWFGSGFSLFSCAIPFASECR